MIPEGYHRIGGFAVSVLAVQEHPFETPFGLWQFTTGRKQREVTPAMQRGLDRENEARVAYEHATGIVVQPEFLAHPEHPWLVGALDGRSMDGDVIAEFKLPRREHHEAALKGEVPPYYRVQCMHYLGLAIATKRPAKVCHYVSLSPDHAQPFALVEVFPESDEIARLYDVAYRFWFEHVMTDTPPPLTDRDTVVRADPAWLSLAEEYRHAESVVTEWSQKQAATKEALIAAAHGAARVKGGGISLTRFWREGTVDYAKLVKDVAPGVDLNTYRKAGAESVRISIDQGE